MTQQCLEMAANDVTGGVIEHCGHWVGEERPEYVVDRLLTSSTSPALTVSQDPRVVTVIERFAVPAGSKDEAVAALERHLKTTWAQDPAFIGAAVLRGWDADIVSCYAQWWRAERQVSQGSPPPERSLAGHLPRAERVESRVFSLDFIEHVDPATTTMRISLPETPLTRYGLFSVTPETQNHAVDLGRANSGTALGTPGLLNINWHRSVDGHKIVNLGTWTTFDGMAELAQKEGFRLGTGEVYWEGHADWQGENYAVVSIVTP